MSAGRGGKGRGGAPGGKGRGGGGKGGGGRGSGGTGGGGTGGSKGRGGPPPTRRSATPGRAPARRDRGRTGTAGGGRTKATGIGGEQVEGRNAVRELLVAGRRRVREVVVSTDRANAPVLDDILTLATQLHVPVRELGRTKLDQLARTEAHQGVVASAAPLPEDELDDLLDGRRSPDGGHPLLLAADGVTDPGNLGALLRTAECAGVTGVVLPRHRAVHVTPAVTKAAAGAVEHLRFAVVGGLPAALASATDAGALVIGLDADGDASVFDLPPLDRPVVLVVGAEGRGLGRLVRQRCEVVASIPMRGATESLNVSVAGGIALFEVLRQRR